MIEIFVALSKPLPSLANSRLHWSAKARLVKAQRRGVGLHLAMAMAQLRATRGPIRLRCTLTRVAARKLDDDNLQGAFKAIRDEVARFFGLDDGSPRWAWGYAQEKPEALGIGYRVKVEVVGVS